MLTNARAMVLASFAADSLALGVHWIYDPAYIQGEFGRVESFLRPKPDSYHPTKDRGEFTHYGDQTMVLLESLAACGRFDLNDFANRWRALFDHYRGYYDGATKATLKNFSNGLGAEKSGSASNDLAGAGRIAPLVYYYQEGIDSLVLAARAQTRMTHADSLTMDAAEFFARVTWKTLQGSLPVVAISEVTEQRFPDSAIAAWVKAGLESTSMDTIAAIGQFGRSCHTPDAFPGVVHLIARYQNDLKEALIQAVMAGGDSAARGMMVGMVLGAHLGGESLPEQWLSSLKKAGEITRLLPEG